MRPDTPEYSANNQTYIVQGNPRYYDDTTGVQEEQEAPLAAAVDWNYIGQIVDGNIVHMVTSTNSTYNVYAVTDQCEVYGITGSTITSLGFPTGSPTANTGARLGIIGTNIYFTYSATTSVWVMALPSGSWSTISTTITSTAGIHHLEPFQNFMAIADASGTANCTYVRTIDPASGTASSYATSLNLGNGYAIMGLRNLNNKYLAIAGAQTNTAYNPGYSQNYLYLWSGGGIGAYAIADFQIKLPGQYIDMKVIDGGQLLIAVQVSSGKSVVYELVGVKLREYHNPQFTGIKNGVYSPVPCSLFDYRGSVGINLQSVTGYSNPIQVVDKDTAFIQNVRSGLGFDQIVVGFDGNIYANEYIISSGLTKLYVYNDTGTTYVPVALQSQWIPVENVQALDIFYATPPQSGTDAVNVTIYGKGEDIITGTSTTVLTAITPTTKLNNSRTRLDAQNFTGDRIMVELSTVNSTWRPIIRAVNIITK